MSQPKKATTPQPKKATTGKPEPLAAPQRSGAGMRVRVKDGEVGYYRRQRLRSGAVFTLHNPELLSERWMERVSDAAQETPDRENGAQLALNKESEAIRLGKDGVDGVGEGI